jgi:hypothetical protein
LSDPHVDAEAQAVLTNSDTVNPEVRILALIVQHLAHQLMLTAGTGSCQINSSAGTST